ncbi:sensor domain-containing protein [Billgrantia sp. Q4P2]|uniref:sensor domain-containing protein n=1 Tax=Billgrantia sp. Q4P2 TaxID=3463857 RepID=UPI0040564C6E
MTRYDNCDKPLPPAVCTTNGTGLEREEWSSREALELAQGIINAIPDVLFEVDRDGRYLNVWTKNFDLLAAPKEALLGRTVHEILPPEQATSAMEALATADEKGVSYGHIISIPQQDGTLLWFEHSLAKKHGERPSEDSFLVLSRDITERKKVEHALEEARTRLLSVVQAIPDAVWLKDMDGIFLFCNQAFEQAVGKPEAEVIGGTDYDLFDPETATRCRETDRAAIEAGRLCIDEEWITHRGIGQRILLETRKIPVFDAKGRMTGVFGVGCDITQRKHMEEALAAREREFRTLVENTPDTVARYDRDFRRLYVNPAFAALIEGGATVLIGKTPSECPGGPTSVIYEQQMRKVFTTAKDREFEFTWKNKGGREFCTLIRLTPEFGEDGTVESVLAVGRDITELNASRQKIHQMAFYDPLTSLPNRALFNDRLRQMIADASCHGQIAGVMLIDLDRFKEVNDTMGHAVGDELLCEVAARLRACVRNHDTVARFGGDEFAILLPEISHGDGLGRIADRILGKFDEPFLLDGKEVFVSCSLGVAVYPDDSSNADDLVKYADSAMYCAKRSGRNNFRYYSEDLTANAQQRLVLESELRRAVERNELELHYQPKVLLHEGMMVGSEALLRWRHPRLGMVPPMQFIQIAEDTGLIVDLGAWVLREACRTAAKWNGEAKPAHKVAINLSARQFQLQDLAGAVADILDDTACRPEWIELEITESLLLDNNDGTLDTLSALRAMGITIAIDDFGTGYSALSYLARFPIDTLKIDRSFIQSAITDHYGAELVKAILSIARSLGQQVVAEGVETVQQAAFLTAHGCQLAQGFLYSKPLPEAEIASLPQAFIGNHPATETARP